MPLQLSPSLGPDSAQPSRCYSIAQRLLDRARLTVTGCWEWTGTVTRSGDPAYSGIAGQQHADRAAFALWRGPIPPARYVVQTCRNRLCINPYHLAALPRRDAIRLHPDWDTELDRWKTGKARPTHCKAGHGFTPENTQWVNVPVKLANGIKRTDRGVLISGIRLKAPRLGKPAAVCIPDSRPRHLYVQRPLREPPITPEVTCTPAV